jgi:hypothetical protein
MVRRATILLAFLALICVAEGAPVVCSSTECVLRLRMPRWGGVLGASARWQLAAATEAERSPVIAAPFLPLIRFQLLLQQLPTGWLN